MKFVKRMMLCLSIIFVLPAAVAIVQAEELQETPSYAQFLEKSSAPEADQPVDAILVSERTPAADTFGNPNDSYLIKSEDQIEFSVHAEQEGMYHLLFNFYPVSSSFSPIDIGVKINDSYQFEEAGSIRLQTDWRDQGDPVLDRYGDEVVPPQEIVKRWYQDHLIDSNGNQHYPYQFHLKKGENKITITSLRTDFMLSNVQATGILQSAAYDQYMQAIPTDAPLVGTLETYEAEQTYSKNKASIIAEGIFDPSVSPYHPINRRINIIGYNAFHTKGDRITWQVEVPETGRYHLTFKVRQQEGELLNASVFRTIRINDQIPFSEMESYRIPYVSRWENHTLQNDHAVPYEFYLEQGTHTISMTIDNSVYQETMDAIEQMNTEINQLSLELRKMTGGTVDRNRDWEISDYFPEIENTLQGWHQELVAIYEYIRDLSENETKASITLQEAYRSIEVLAQQPNDLPNQISALSTGGNSITAMLANARDALNIQPLSMDQLYVHGDHELPNPEVGAWRRFTDGITRFLGTFGNPQGSNPVQAEKEINVWVKGSRTYVTTLQQLIDTEFTPKTGIRVNLTMMEDENKVILAAASNTNPDMAIGMNTNMPYEMGERRAAADLSSMPGFLDVMQDFAPGSFLSYVIGDGIYGLPETQDFWVLFYRKDILDQLGLEIPNTWDDVIDMLPALQRNGMNFVSNVATFEAYKPFAATLPSIVQNGGQVLHPDGMSTAINEENSLRGLQSLTDLFTIYSLPTQIGMGRFFEYLKSGDYPIGVGAMATYLQLTYAADELAGKWDIAPLPGTPNEDGEVLRYAPGSATSSIIFENSDQKEEAWELLKWYMSTETQISYSNLLYSKYGDGFLWNSANLNAFAESVLPQEHRDAILKQWEWLVEVPRVPGHYMIERELSNIWNRVVFDGVNVREAADDSAIIINREILRKMEDYKYIVDGKIVRQYKLPTLERLESWGSNEKKEAQ